MAHAPENSLPAFQRAVADSADGVELDVRLCRGGDVVVFHDADLRRLGGVPGRIADLTWPELAALRLTSGAQISRLQDVFLELPKGFLVNVEIKVDPGEDAATAELVAATGAVLQAWRDRLQLLVSSFDVEVVTQWAARFPSVPAGFLFEDTVPARLPALAAVHPHFELCTPERVKAWHDAGYAVNVWTVNEDADAVRLAKMGVDALISNDPARIRAAFF